MVLFILAVHLCCFSLWFVQRHAMTDWMSGCTVVNGLESIYVGVASITYLLLLVSVGVLAFDYLVEHP
jgi:hypothetical protein